MNGKILLHVLDADAFFRYNQLYYIKITVEMHIWFMHSPPCQQCNIKKGWL